MGRAAWAVAVALAAGLAGPGRAQEPAPTDDPRQGFLPKQALGVAEYLAANPTHDGRGVRVAIIDTGIDLLHPGLARTSTGARKIVGFYDATDAGDVDTSCVREAGDGALTGLTGRTLSLGAWRADDGAFHCGVVRAARVFPGGLHERLLASRKEARAALDRRTVAPDEKTLDATAKARREDRAAADEADAGGAFDCLAFRADGEWRVVMDTDADGDCGEEAALRAFATSGDVGRFGEEAQFGFAVEVQDEGNRTVLLFDGGGHGTHVAGIVSAWYGPGDPLNGLAPGAELLAVRCGNTRLGGATSHLSIVKGIDWACRHGADVINISFGGDSFFRNGREVTARFVDDAVRRYGVPVVFSAGNDGPALGTLGSPATAWRAWAIGAWAPAATQEASYGVAKPLGGRLFDFSSCGPSHLGDCGVDFLAPGAAVSPIPTWHLGRHENWNGTSMAAPQATGALAVIVSAAKARGLAVNDNRLRQACAATARPVAGCSPFQQGAGLLQVGPAVAELVRLAGAPERVRIAVRRAPGGPAAGILERDFRETIPWRTSLFVAPDLPEAREPGGAAARAAWAETVTLAPDVPWLEVARVVDLAAAGAWLPVTVLPDKLAEGCNIGRVVGRAADGSLRFEIPATVIRPERPDARTHSWRATWAFAPGDRRAAFVAVPLGATRVRLRGTGTGPHRNRYTVALHAASGWHGTRPGQRERVWAEPGVPFEVDAPVEGGSTLEIVVVSRWQESREGSLAVEAEFLGVTVADAVVQVPPGRTSAHWRLRADLADVSAKISAAVTHRCEVLALDWTVAPDPRQESVLDGETLYRGVGTTTLTSADGKPCTVDMGFDPQWADYLDDAFWEAIDAEGRPLASGFFWKGSFDFDPPHAGGFTLRCTITERGRVRLDRRGLLAPRVLHPIGKKACTLHADIDGELPGGGDAPGTWRWSRGESVAPFVRLPDLAPGRYTGTLELRDVRTNLVLAESRLEVDATPPADPKKDIERRLRREVEAVLGRFALDDADVQGLEKRVAAARRADVPEDVVERWYVDLTLARPDAGRADLDGVATILDRRARHEGGKLGAEKRAELVWAHLARADLARRRGDAESAWRAFHAALVLDPQADGREMVELRLHLADGDWVKAQTLARALIRARADDHDLALARWRCYRALGWDDRVAEELASWTDRFPRRRDEVFALATEPPMAPRAKPAPSDDGNGSTR